MNKTAILFLHHLPLNEAVTRKHIALIRALNRDCDVIPICFDQGRETSGWQWKNPDIMVYEWFDRANPKHDRFIFLEYDTFCSMPVKEFYGNAFDRPAVSSIVVRPWSAEVIIGSHGEPVREKDWHWWQQCESAELYPYLRGMMPTCGQLFRHDALFNIVQCWKTIRSADNFLSEARIGTFACMSGFEPERIRPDCHEFIHSGNVCWDERPGIFHRVKE